MFVYVSDGLCVFLFSVGMCVYMCVCVCVCVCVCPCHVGSPFVLFPPLSLSLSLSFSLSGEEKQGIRDGF